MHDTPQQSSKNQVSLQLILAALALIGAAGMAMWVTPLAIKYIAWRRFDAENERIETIVEGWRAPPAHADPDDWEFAWITVYIAVGNVCFTPDLVSAEEMARLRLDVERKNRQPVTFDTFAWLWSRLGQTGPHGNEYITRMQPMWEEVEKSYVKSGNDQSFRPALVPR